MRYVKVDGYDKDEKLKELGCPYPNNPDYYSFTISGHKHIEEQTCVELFTSKKESVDKYYSIQHYSIETACVDATDVLCVRSKFGSGYIITKHKRGACPLCKYHTEEEYDDYVLRSFGRSNMEVRQHNRRRKREARKALQT